MTRSGIIAIVLVLVGCKQSAPVESPAEPAASEPAACDALGASECAQRSDCTAIEAQQHIVDHPCVVAPAAVGCMSADAACDDGITFARDPDNNVYWFMDTCIPSGWTSEPYPQGLSEPPPSC